ncbi:MAG TPA: ABC transporter substrate-binding protein [Thermomicrobiales bacterium]|nr:ABC transporter substrate-binding protein [Thermomicrobiales bacterium]
MARIDWSVLSGPRVSRRTLLSLAVASGATGYASRLVASAAPISTSRPMRQLRFQGEPKTGGTLRLGFGITQIPNLDPAKVNLGIVAGELVSNLFSSLVQFDTELGLVPDLAENWTVSEDGLNYSFTLRDGLTFHNGDPLRAADFVYTYERTIDPDFASPHANKLALVESVDSPDDLTVEFTLSAPFAPFLSVAGVRGPGRALAPIPQRAFEEMGEEQFDQTPVGCGPFAIVAETADLSSGFELVAFDGWYGGRPLLDAIEVTLIPEPSSRISALEAGDVDMLDIVPTIGVAQLMENPDLTIVQGPGTSWTGLAMNYNRPPWDNPDARMAVAKAINRDDLVATAFFGLGTPGIGAIAPAFGWAYVPPEEAESPQAFNLEEARALAETAGIDGAAPTIMAVPDDQRAAEVLRNQLVDLGLDVQFEQLQAAAWDERWLAGDFDWVINGSIADADPDDGHWNFFHSEGPWNTHGYSNPEVDRLLEATRSTGVQEERAELFRELQSVLQADVPYAFLYHSIDTTGFHNDVQGYVPIPEMRYMETVWLDR